MKENESDYDVDGERRRGGNYSWASGCGGTGEVVIREPLLKKCF